MATNPQLTLKERFVKARVWALAQGVQIWKLEGSEVPQYAVPRFQPFQLGVTATPKVLAKGFS